MSDIKYTKELNELNIQSLRKTQRDMYRKNLTHQFVQEWKELHYKAKELLDDERRGAHVYMMSEFLFLVTESIAKLSEAPIPKYYTYTDVKLLDWFIGKEHKTYDHYRKKCTQGILYLTIEFLKFESDSMGNVIKYNQSNIANIDLTDRIKKIGDVMKDATKLYQFVFGIEFEENIIRQHYNTISEYITEPDKINGLLDFTCFPRTATHDEYAFIRTIHISEFCFLGIINSIKETIDNIKFNQNPEKAIVPLKFALIFTDILHKIFKVLRTMPSTPVNNFSFFRDETGNASAVQSKNYQELDVYLRGIDIQKREVFIENPHLKYLEKFAHEKFTYNFRDSLKMINKNAPEWKDFFDVAKSLDSKLITWKGLHLGFAYAYLPKGATGTGSTTGASYLEKFIKSSVFDDTKIDYELFKQDFSDKEFPELYKMLTRVDSRIGTSIN